MVSKALLVRSVCLCVFARRQASPNLHEKYHISCRKTLLFRGFNRLRLNQDIWYDYVSLHGFKTLGTFKYVVQSSILNQPWGHLVGACWCVPNNKGTDHRAPTNFVTLWLVWMGAFPNICKLFVPARTARNVNAVSRPYGTKNPGLWSHR